VGPPCRPPTSPPTDATAGTLHIRYRICGNGTVTVALYRIHPHSRWQRSAVASVAVKVGRARAGVAGLRIPRSINGRYRPNVTIAARIGHRENVSRTLTIKAARRHRCPKVASDQSRPRRVSRSRLCRVGCRHVMRRCNRVHVQAPIRLGSSPPLRVVSASAIDQIAFRGRCSQKARIPVPAVCSRGGRRACSPSLVCVEVPRGLCGGV